MSVYILTMKLYNALFFQLLSGSLKTSSLSPLSTTWVNSPISIRCVFCKKKLREILCPDLRQAKFSHPTHYTHIFASVTLHMRGTEKTKYAHQQWTRQAHCAHQVLTAELWKFLPFACYEISTIWMHLSRNQK